MAKKKTADRFFNSKHHEEDLFQVNISSQTVSISQNFNGDIVKSFLTFEAIEELYNEIQQHKKEGK